MKSFEYEITDDMGLHVRPAGLLTKFAAKYKSEITLSHRGKSAVCSRLLAIMAMQVKKGDVVSISIDGEDEETAFTELTKFCTENL